MRNLGLGDLVIEVTRRCNMNCDHCLRGCAQNVDMDHKYIDSLLSQVENIGSLAFTGGEPSLNTKTISYCLEQLKLKEIPVSSFYIATNGTNCDIDFVTVCLQLYAYCDEKEICCVDVSNDMYHAEWDSYDTELLEGLSFFGFKNTTSEYTDPSHLINQGNASENFEGQGMRTLENGDLDIQEDYIGETITLNCIGNVVSGCDWSYDSQDEPWNILCEISELTQFVKDNQDSEV